MVEVVDTAIAQLADAGFDLAHAFDTHAAAREPGWERLAQAPRYGIVIGNTRALWPHFVAAMRDRELAADPDPLERYTERTIDAAAPGAVVYYSHRRYAGAFLPFQRLAVATGLGALAPSQIVIHPIYGPWFALRAVIAVDGTPPARAPIARPCACTAACDRALTAALEAPESTSWRAWLAVRDACTLRAWRYSEEQAAYHGTKVWAPQEG